MAKIIKKNHSKEKSSVSASLDDEPVVLGVGVEPSLKQSSPNSVGCSLGVTKNMGGYQSLRVDVWASCEVNEGETHEEVYQRIVGTCGTLLEQTVEAYSD